MERIYKRTETDLPLATENWGWKYHHLGVPTDKKRANESYLPKFGFHISGFESCPFGIEWMRFEADSPMHELIQTVPHLAFEVEDIDYELRTKRFKVIAEPNSPSSGIRVAMIEHNGAPIELIEFNKGKGPVAK